MTTSEETQNAMNRFDDDEVRDALRAQADRVAPPGDLLGGVVLRAARARKRRRRARIAAGGCAVLAIAAASPYAANALRRHNDTPKPIALAPLAPASTAPADPARPAPTPVPATPANALPWPVRGVAAPAELVSRAKDYCEKAQNAGAVTVQQLWTGKLADKNLGYVGQCWSSTPTADWHSTLVVLESQPNGAAARYLRTGEIYFTHSSAGEDAAALRTDMPRVAVLTINLGAEVLALAGPGTDTLWYASDGMHFHKLSTNAGGARFVRAKTPTGDLIQARDRAGRALTHPDAFAVRIAQHKVVQPGWALVDVE